jgi:activator of 2-hydroxyglutaryl-CoA dehydratase
MSVYVVNLRNQPLMPTTPRNARLLVKEGKAKVVKRNPFTIQLLYATGESKQDLTLGIDSGYLNIGFSVVSEKEEVVSGEVKLLQGMKERLKDKAQYRRIRRQRLRYRKPRWHNRKKEEGWLAPSIQHKLDSHLRFYSERLV